MNDITKNKIREELYKQVSITEGRGLKWRTDDWIDFIFSQFDLLLEEKVKEIDKKRKEFFDLAKHADISMVDYHERIEGLNEAQQIIKN
jgi:hypothetical protein